MAAHPEHCPRAPEEKWAGIVSLIGVVAVEQDAIEMQREGEIGLRSQSYRVCIYIWVGGQVMVDRSSRRTYVSVRCYVLSDSFGHGSG